MLRTIALTAAAALAVAGCSSTIPPELADARDAFEQASEGPARKYDPAALYKAKKSLALAEKTYDVEGDTAATRDRAYVAERKSQLATIEARMLKNEIQLAELKEKRIEQQTTDLAQTRRELEQQRAELKAERQRRERAEKLAEQAAQDLAKIATVTQEPRGTVITLSGSVLFASGQSELMGPARARLSQVATSLTQSYPAAEIVVEGHTDSQGSEQFNQQLSQARAEAVAGYLEEHGVAEDRISARGRGESEPTATNQTAEGRANNRRVEIIVNPRKAALSGGADGATGKLPGPQDAAKQAGEMKGEGSSDPASQNE